MYDICCELEADQSELIALNRHLGEGERECDIALLQTLLSDDLLYRRSDGSIISKPEFLAQLHCPKCTYDYLESENIEVAVNEEAGRRTAVVSLLVVAKGCKGRRPFAGVFHNVRLFVKQEEGWRCRVWLSMRVAESKIISQ